MVSMTLSKKASRCIKLPHFKRYPITTIGVSSDRIIGGKYAIISGNSFLSGLQHGSSKSQIKRLDLILIGRNITVTISFWDGIHSINT